MARTLGWLMLFIVLASPYGLYLLLIDDTASVAAPAPPSPDDALRARALARLIVMVLDGDAPAEIVVTAGDARSLASLAARAMPGLAGDMRLSARAIELRASVPVPPRLAGGYINADIVVVPSDQGLRVGRCRIGALTIPGGVALWAVERLTNLVLGDALGTRVLGSIERIEAAPDVARVEVDPSGNFRAALEALRNRFRSVRDWVQPAGDPRRIGVYYDRIMELERALGPSNRRSLALYVASLFDLAQARSAASDPIIENESLIYALATYFASYRFATLTGMQRTGAIAEPGWHSEPLLGERRDLRLHFLVSAGIELLSNHDISIAAGEFKELLDSGEGGSGFSFSDLAADRAGALFARLATAGYLPAREMQRRLANNPDEVAFFPDIAGLRDDMPKAEFEREFGGLDSESYQRALADIDDRILRLPAYHELLQFLPDSEG